jgi:2-polyprenyl-3-methyl-5-hydroxy-6-metoxy-1,4-benzoquinol methylase
MQLEQIFSLARKKWGGNGSGSTPQKTQKLIAAVAPLLAELEVKSVLDLGCGSPPWLATVAHAAGARYVGVDVVGEVVEGNRKLDLPDAEFLKLEESTVLPICDLVFCRDVMPHLSTDNVLALLRRIKQSGAT